MDCCYMKKIFSTFVLFASLLAFAGCGGSIPFSELHDTLKNNVETKGPYKVGDYYNENGKRGVVFYIEASGKHGKIVSLTESGNALQWSSNEIEQTKLIGANSETDGAYNMSVVKKISNWQSKYPAFKWCADLGEGWYLPAIKELEIFTYYNDIRNAVNRTLADKDGNEIPDIGTACWYWSSTEKNYLHGSTHFSAWRISMSNGSDDCAYKYLNYYVRAVAAF